MLAESDGGALDTLTVFVSSGVLFALVDTAKLKLLVGAYTLNTTLTVAPALIPELQLIVNMMPVELGL
jgi:hypothetical protein